ncbi:DUF1203 domain-containing protein [Sphaerisporangium sp. NPDC005289]|uniref:DUF1203 domain-containing protein n=1 Tax=Sphaerisporangium sp. NPDC005289 TaxID=3155247 RepID=UPI0033A9ABFD
MTSNDDIGSVTTSPAVTATVPGQDGGARFGVRVLAAAALARARAGRDASGNPPERVTAGGGEPLRCCLRDAAAGEELLLFGYEPPIPASPYREIGAVFAHARPCAGPAALDRYPAGWYGRPQVLRAYDARGWIHPATRVHDGSDPEAVIARMLAEPEVVEIHSRNVAYGCYMFTLTRPDAAGDDA